MPIDATPNSVMRMKLADVKTSLRCIRNLQFAGNSCRWFGEVKHCVAARIACGLGNVKRSSADSIPPDGEGKNWMEHTHLTGIGLFMPDSLIGPWIN